MKIDKISKYAVRIDAHSDESEASDHADDESNNDHKESERSDEEEEGPKKNEAEQEWYKTMGAVRDFEIDDVDFEDLDDEDKALLAKEPLNIR